ncbi:MAG: polyhydroxyalkanoic acid system family protein [Sphingomonas sp.]
MANPTIIDIPHTLGREEARRRMKARIGELPGYMPGGVAEVASSWPTEDRMALEVKALGQAVSATAQVADDHIRVALVLPPMLGMFADRIGDAIARKGGALLLGEKG